MGQSTSLVGQPYTLTFDLNSSAFYSGSGPPSNCGLCYLSNANSGTTTLTIGALSSTLNNNVFSSITLGPQPITGLSGIQVNASGFAVSASSMVLDPALPVPNPFTLNGTFSTAVNTHEYTFSGGGFVSQGDFAYISGGTPLGPYSLTGLEGTVTHLTISNQPPPPPQVVYLDFGAGRAVIEADSVNPANNIPRQNFPKPDAGLSQAQMATIVATVQGIYAKYNVLFTDTLPVSGNYETIYIGGTRANLAPATAAGIASTTLGIASNINISDSIPGDSAVVFSGNPNFDTCPAIPFVNCPDIGLLSQTIAHETGHILGLAHTDSTITAVTVPDTVPVPDLISPIASSSSTLITVGPVNRAERDGHGNITTLDPLGFAYGLQNSDANLLCGVGASPTGIKDCSGVIGFTDTDFSLASTASALFNAKVLVDRPGTDPDAGDVAFGLGTINPGFNELLSLPLSPDDTFALEGSLTPDGPDTLFNLSPFNVDGNNPSLFADGALFSSVPEPSSLLLLVVGLATIIGFSECSKLRAGIGGSL